MFRKRPICKSQTTQPSQLPLPSPKPTTKSTKTRHLLAPTRSHQSTTPKPGLITITPTIPANRIPYQIKLHKNPNPALTQSMASPKAAPATVATSITADPSRSAGLLSHLEPRLDLHIH
ncbi:hypothetical protein M0R45_008940 [Rubus argutus]|uniref:Uncharacterized protein n=1 Tax=Rubus argutus TaxID=59490 RepID=A0AAW1Y4I4_RUBAR